MENDYEETAEVKAILAKLACQDSSLKTGQGAQTWLGGGR